MSRTLIVFAKEPVLGTVKTRLKNCFSDRQLLGLYKAFVKDTLDIARNVRCKKRFLAFSSLTDPRYLKSIGSDFELIEQRGRNLGQRMHNAFVYTKNGKPEKSIIIGTDSPTLPVKFIEKAFKRLDRHDLVLGPSSDGGYYLIGMKEPSSGVFKGMRWGSSGVLGNTLTAAKKLGKTTALIDPWYDVDNHTGLLRLKINLKKDKNNNARHTKSFLKI